MNIALNDVGAAVLSNAVLVVPLAVLAAIVCRLVQRPAVAWCLWGLVLLKFVTPAWYPCVWTPWTPTYGVSSGGSAMTGVDQPLLSSDQPRWIHRVSSRAEPLPDEVGEELFAGHDAGVDAAEPTSDEGAAADADASDSGDVVPQPIEVAAEGAPPPPPLPVFSDVPNRESLTVTELAGLPIERRAVESAAAALASSKVVERTAENDTESRALPRRSSASQEGFGHHTASAPIGGLTSAARPTMEIVVRLLLGVGAAGAVALVMLAGMRVGRFRKLLRQAEPASEELVASARRLAAKLGCRSAPALRVTRGRVPPVLWGLGRRAVILLPRGLLNELDDEQRSALLAHELAHFARRDHWMRWFEFAVRSLYWWHPVAWWAGRRLREAEEQCCDGWVVRLLPDSPPRYADALLKTVDYLAAAPRTVPTLATGITLRRSLRPFHRRLTMIIDHQPNPRLTWPARLCLLALAGVVLPASIVAVAEDEPTKEPQSTATSGNTPPDSVTATEILDDESARQEENIKTKTFTVPNNINFDAINQFLHSFYILRPKPAVTIRARDGNFEIVVRSTEEQLKAVERVIAAMTGASDSATSKVSASGETITVVRAQYVLPHNVAEAFDKFIQQHGEHFEFLVSKVSGAPRNSFGDPMMGMDMGVDMGMGAGMGMGLDPSMLEMGDEYGIGAGMMRGGFARRGLSRGARRGDTQSQLTIIATPEVQQQFGDFIKALSAVQQPKARAADEDATETLTLTRAHYDLPVVSTSALLEVSRPYGFGPSILNDPRGRRAFINDLLTGDTLPPSLGIGVWDILTAVKQSNLVPLLLISADDDRLTVTTTEDFQQQLGKFIRFLQEHEPQTDDEQTKRRPESDSADISRIADQHQREQKAAALLKKAREFLSKGELGRARAMVMEASKLDVDYHLFDDRPEHVLADIERREGRARDEGKLTVLRADSGSIQSLAGEWPPQRKSSGSRLSELRDQERELSALLSVIDESLKEEANRMLLLLAINQFYGDNAASASLIEMFNKLVELETQKGELVQSHGLRHPSLMFVQQRIDTYRRSFGLPTGDDAQPLDLLDIYVQALKRQLDVTRKVIDALEKSK